MALKALYPISLQKETGVPHVARQSADANETRLNENFKRITEQLAELYNRKEFDPRIDQEILLLRDAIRALEDERHGRNLLHNWDFRNPVNQRGSSSYTATTAKYAIDRWKIINGTLTVGSGHVRFATTSGVTDFKHIIQLTEQTLYAGQTYTLSMLAKVSSASGWVRFLPCTASLGGITGCDGLVFSVTNDYELISYTFTPTADVSNFGVEIVGNQDAAFDILMKSWKLEQGSVSTLLQDAPADYGEQLALCQRYFIAVPAYMPLACYLNSTTSVNISVPVPVEMRINPTITISGDVALFAGSKAVTLANASISNSSGHKKGGVVMVTLTASSALSLTTYTSVIARPNGMWTLSADL